MPSRYLFVSILAANLMIADDWTDYRGPQRNGVSMEKNLPSSWSPQGENLAWKAPYGGRSAPVIHGNRLYIFNTVGKGATLQERLVCLNADTGALLWEHRMNVYLSDVPPHRAAWSSPAVDPETGNVYVFGVHGALVAVNRLGKVVWQKSLVEEQGLITTHGGRTVSPVVYQNLVIVSGISNGWGDHARAAHRFFAFDKRTGELVWISTPGGRPYDTTYSPPVIAEVEGTKLLISGGGDGAVHAIQPLTGEPVWKFEMSKRGINTGVVVLGNYAIVSHSEENLDTSEMGLLASIHANRKGTLGPADVRWAIKGFQGGFSSPIMDGDRVFQIDNGANLYAFDFHTGRQLWKQNLGTIQKASPVWADGKIYVGTENGKFFILRPHQDRCEIVDADELGAAGKEQIIASAAVARGRIYFVSTEAVYAIGKKGPGTPPPPYRPEPVPILTSENPFTHVQVVPAELILRPGQSVTFQVRMFDQRGRFMQVAEAVTWTMEGLKGTMSGNTFTAPKDATPQAGLLKATVSHIPGVARIRIIPPMPVSEDFEGIAPGQVPRHWTNTLGKYVVREMNGKKVLVKLADNAFTKRARSFVAPADWKNYTVECDISATERRRQMGDAGIVAQRYQLALFGNHQRLELQSWQPETERTVSIPFPWQKDTWYRLKLRVDTLPDGKVRAQGKAWPVNEPEPEQWLIEKIDPLGNREGAPGIYADAPFEIFFDNFKVTPNMNGTQTRSTLPKKVASK
ncbi:MAG: PQQ-like beta-propeller repeat protein [Bryobacteraceae bacterium]|nr:PQQ-like beta-propeller repeat protein [Bryobacteraceae bacterium]MDW8377845.1 PQQ-binding-like beta-propeller repeat protein [Bryobacterales bacterium]